VQTTIFNGKVVDRAPVRGSSADDQRTVYAYTRCPKGRLEIRDNRPAAGIVGFSMRL